MGRESTGLCDNSTQKLAIPAKNKRQANEIGKRNSLKLGIQKGTTETSNLTTRKSYLKTDRKAKWST